MVPLTDACRDLIQRIFVKDPAQRITLPLERFKLCGKGISLLDEPCQIVLRSFDAGEQLTELLLERAA